MKNSKPCHVAFVLLVALAVSSPGQPDLRFEVTPSAEVALGAPVRFDWRGGDEGQEFRYKMEGPGGGSGAAAYPVGNWSPWSDSRTVTLDDLAADGAYTFVVEARSPGGSPAGRISFTFAVKFLVSSVADAGIEIDWSRVRRAGTAVGRYRILAEEYQAAYEFWRSRFELESRVLKLSVSREEFVLQGASMVDQSGRAVLAKWASDGVSVAPGRFLSGVLPAIIGHFGLDAVLILKNGPAFRAAMAAIASYVAWHGYADLGDGAPSRTGKEEAGAEYIDDARRSMAAPSAGLDIVFCIDTTQSMAPSIAAVKHSATALIDRIFRLGVSVRIALVAYRDYGSEYVTRPFPFTSNKDEIRRDVTSLNIGEGGDPPEAVHEALLEAIHGESIGGWRSGAKRLVVLMGDAPPHEKQHTLDEVVQAAEEQGVRIFPIVTERPESQTRSAFASIANRTHGIMATTSTAEALPEEMSRMAELGAMIMSAGVVSGTVVRVMGDNLEVRLDSAADLVTDTAAIILSRVTPGLVLTEGAVLAGEGKDYVVELRGGAGTQQVTANCKVLILKR